MVRRRAIIEVEGRPRVLEAQESTAVQQMRNTDSREGCTVRDRACTQCLPAVATCLLSVIILAASPAIAHPPDDSSQLRQQLIPILATTFDHANNAVGTVAAIQISLEDRDDHGGMDVRFETRPGRFSRTAQVAVLTGILHTARAARLNPDSWSVSLMVPHRGVTVYGTSLSAMVGLTVIALAQGELIKPYRVITGTVRPDGHIGAVGGIALKLQAAQEEHLTRVLVPDEYDVSDGDWKTPFLLHVSPVGTVTRAYQALTDRAFPGQRSRSPG